MEHTTLAALVAAIDKERGAAGLSSAVRVWLLDFFRNPRTDSSADIETGQRNDVGLSRRGDQFGLFCSERRT